MKRDEEPGTAAMPGAVSAATDVEFAPGAHAASDSFNGLTSLLRHVLSDLTHAADRHLASRALTFAKSMPLIALLDDQRHTASSIARRMRCDAGALTRIVSELEDKGLITRERSLADRRVVHLQLTARGRDVARDMPAILHDVMEANLACLTAPERRMLAGLLLRVCSAPTRERSMNP